jgi:hypothetical protein
MDNQALSEIRAIDIIKNKEIANDYRTLYLATSFGDFDTVKLLIEGKGLNPNKIMRGPSLCPELCLDTAIRRNQVNIAKYLIAKGADINLLPYPGISFTEWVLKKRFKPDIFELFVKELVKKNKLANIDPNTRETLLHKLTDNTYYNLEYQKYTIPMILNELLNQLGPKGTL